MSEERRNRQQERDEPPAAKSALRKIAIALLVITAFAAAWYLGRHRRTSRYDALARCLTDKKATMYGLSWCPHCKDQEDMFGPSFEYINYVECGIEGVRQEQPRCIDAGIKNFPTWQFASGERHEGVLPLEELARKTGCSLP